MAHRAKEKKSKTRCTSGPRPMYLSRHLLAQGKISRHTPLSVLDRFFFLSHSLAQSRSPRDTAQSVLDRFFFSTPPWHSAAVLDRLLNRSSNDFFDFCISSYATPWHRVEVLDTLLNRSSTDFFLFHHVAQTRGHRAEVLDALLKRSTPPSGQTNKTKHHCQTKTDLD